jgi:starch synthase (maltosyl-transferring)
MPLERQAVRGRCAYAIPPSNASADIRKAVAAAGGLGFDTLVLLAGLPHDPAADDVPAASLGAIARGAHAQGLKFRINLSLDRIASYHAAAGSRCREVFSPAPVRPWAVLDPRQSIDRGAGVLSLRRPDDAALRAWWLERLTRLRDQGADGFTVISSSKGGRMLAEILNEAGYGIDHYSERDMVPHDVGGNIFVAGGARIANAARRRALLAAVAFAADSWMLEAGMERGLEAAVQRANALLRERQPGEPGPARRWTGPAATLAIVSHPKAGGTILLVQNRGPAPQPWPPRFLPPLPWQVFTPAAGLAGDCSSIAPGETWLLHAAEAAPVSPRPHATASQAADQAARIVIAAMSPSVDRGAYAVKRVIAEPIDVIADIFTDGHEQLAASVLTRAEDETSWARHDMRAEANDVWTVSFHFSRLGRHEMMIEAWIDEWGGFARDLAAKRDAGLTVPLEIRQARALLEAALPRASAEAAREIKDVLARLDEPGTTDPASRLLAPPLAAAMAVSAERRFVTSGFVQTVDVEREAARFSSWYELFPRSQTHDPARHGTLSDVIARLPHLAAMGFDTLYLPPIHPIGSRNRKGRNNALTASPGDVGSPYAIGAEAGGHDAIHPLLGTLADFHALVAAARAHGMEIALDFAVQCSPDHPWLKQHPGWFAWQPDGSLKYAENPPKKYEDIVNVDFFGPDAVPALWEALRDIALFWIAQGVRVLRVDNPHTKPQAFWQWMIASVKARHPDAIFLSEAFTRPKRMYHLAKLGFSQSYSYFTWRNTKAELTEYLTELSDTGAREFFRPHFFVNTPDINPYFLQHSGRAGFLIRVALAATLSGLWGMYAGFEFCEAASVPGREEYLDSEKYEIRPRPDRAPGDIVDEITALNRLRRAHPALQSHLHVSFHNAFNDQILYFSKAAPGEDDRILVAVSLDPFASQEADFEMPLWLFGLPDAGSLLVEDLLAGHNFVWTGKMQHMVLTRIRPYAIWRLARIED